MTAPYIPPDPHDRIFDELRRGMRADALSTFDPFANQPPPRVEMHQPVAPADVTRTRAGAPRGLEVSAGSAARLREEILPAIDIVTQGLGTLSALRHAARTTPRFIPARGEAIARVMSPEELAARARGFEHPLDEPTFIRRKRAQTGDFSQLPKPLKELEVETDQLLREMGLDPEVIERAKGGQSVADKALREARATYVVQEATGVPTASAVSPQDILQRFFGPRQMRGETSSGEILALRTRRGTQIYMHPSLLDPSLPRPAGMVRSEVVHALPEKQLRRIMSALTKLSRDTRRPPRSQ